MINYFEIRRPIDYHLFALKVISAEAAVIGLSYLGVVAQKYEKETYLSDKPHAVAIV